MSEELELAVLSSPERLSIEGFLVFEAQAEVERTSIIPRQLLPSKCLHKGRGKVIFSLFELPLRKTFLTENENFLERLSHRYVSFGKENFFLPVSPPETTLEMLPRQLLENIWQQLSQKDRNNAKRVNKTWKKMAETLQELPLPLFSSLPTSLSLSRTLPKITLSPVPPVAEQTEELPPLVLERMRLSSKSRKGKDFSSSSSSALFARTTSPILFSPPTPTLRCR